MSSSKLLQLPTASQALPGRTEPMPVINRHHVNAHVIQSPFPPSLASAVFGLGCFWGAERKFWQTPGVYSTAVGYAGGVTKNPWNLKQGSSGSSAGSASSTVAGLVAFSIGTETLGSIVSPATRCGGRGLPCRAGGPHQRGPACPRHPGAGLHRER